eukprot:1086100_1
MTAIVSNDACENDVTVATEATKDAPNDVALSEPQFAKQGTLEPSRAPELHAQDSISVRRTRKLTDLLFDEIAGKKLKCYEQWKLWLGLCICMSVIAVVAIAFASYYAVQVHAYETKTEAVDAQTNLIYDIVHDDTANITDHVDETHKIFNTFDDNDDGVWDSDEFLEHFLLGVASDSVFDAIDADDDDILSWKEIVASIGINGLSQSYIESVRDMYNYTFDASDPMLNQYAANVYLGKYNVDEFGYLTKSRFYGARSNESFDYSDTNDDNVISFDEFVEKIANDRMISFLRVWNIESYLENTEAIDGRDYLDLLNPTLNSGGATNMCPANDARRRRLQVPADSEDILFDAEGSLIYEYNHTTCEAALVCRSLDRSYYGDEYTIEEDCLSFQVTEIVECMVVAINLYFFDHTNMIQCTNQMTGCLSDYSHSWAFFWKCENIQCDCECSDGCRGHIKNVFNADRRRRLGSCDDKNCACGAGCTCFSGDNQMWIKRNDVIQNILLKELRIGDYAQSKHGEWSKVWFIKEEESSEYEFLKLYFDEDEFITMTNHHLLYVDEMVEASMKRADQVEIGDVVFVMKNASFFESAEIVRIESTISSDGAYAPVTMSGSIVVNNVVSSCYVESPQKAQRLHDTAAVFRWISSYNTNAASFLCHLFYDSLFMKLRTDYGLDAAHVVFNAYSMPCIVVLTLNVAIFGLVRSFSSLF